MRTFRNFLIGMLVVLEIFSCKNAFAITNNALARNKNNHYGIIINIPEFKLYLVNLETNRIERTYPIAAGKPGTPSPCGRWMIVHKDADWGTGFGTRWMQLNVPWGNYGIHGTNSPSSISNPRSHGCIRMFNRDVEELYRYVSVGTPVVIDGGPYGLMWSAFRTLVPGDRGADVLEVQRRLRDIGYYKGRLDGIYGEGMKRVIIKYRKDNNLKESHDVDRDFYNSIGIFPFE